MTAGPVSPPSRSFKTKRIGKASLKMNHLNLDVSHKAIVDSRLSLAQGCVLSSAEAWRLEEVLVSKDQRMSAVARAESRV